MNLVVLGVLCYIVAQLGVAFAVSRSVRTEEDYLVAGRRLGYGLTTFTVFATWFGAETCIGSAGAVYTDGLEGGTSDPFGYAGCLLLAGLLLAAPLWRRKITTLADLFRRRYSPGVERLTVLLMVPTSLMWAAAQIRAFGQVLAAAGAWEVTLTIRVAAGVVIVYTVFGGMLADAWTDLIQGIMLGIGLITLFVAVLVRDGGELGALEPGQLALFGAAERPLLHVVEDWAIPVLGSVTAAELVARLVAARSPVVARRSCLLATFIYVALGSIPVMLALIGSRTLPGLEDGEQILPLMAERYLPAWCYVLFAGALVSAILSTVDSALLVSASLAAHNVIVPLAPRLTERGKVRVARGCVVLLGLLAYWMASEAEGVYHLVEEASAFGSAGIVVVTLAALFTRFGGTRAAYASLLAGVLVWIRGAYGGGFLGQPFATPYLVSLAAAFGTYVLVGLIEARMPAAPRGAPEG